MNIDLAKMCIEEALHNPERSEHLLIRALEALQVTDQEQKMKELVTEALQQKLSTDVPVDDNVLSVSVNEKLQVKDVFGRSE